MSIIINKDQDFLSILAILMNDYDFKDFCKTNLSTWSDSKAALMMINMYVIIDEECGEKLSSTEIINIIRQMMKNTDTRNALITSMIKYIENPDSKFKTHIKNYISNNNFISNNKCINL
jgi:hypothetical protein